MFTPYAFIKNRNISLSLNDLVLSPVINNNENYDDYGLNTLIEDVEPNGKQNVIDANRSEGKGELDNYQLELENFLRKSNNTVYENTLLKFIEDKYSTQYNHISVCNLNKSVYDSPNYNRKHDSKIRMDEISKPLPHKVWRPMDQVQSPFQSTNNLGRQRPPPINSSNSPHSSNMRYTLHKDNHIYDSKVLLHSPNNNDITKSVTIASFNKWLRTRSGKAYSLQNSPNKITNNSPSSIKNKNRLSKNINHEGNENSNKNVLFKSNREEYYLLDVFERLSLKQQQQRGNDDKNHVLDDHNKIISTTRSASPTISTRSRYLTKKYRQRRQRSLSSSGDLNNTLFVSRSKSLENNNYPINAANNEKNKAYEIKTNMTVTDNTHDTLLTNPLTKRVLKDIANAKIKAKRNLTLKSRKYNQNVKRTSEGMYNVNSSFEERNLKSIESIFIRKELARKYPFHPGPNQYNNCCPKDAQRILSSPPRRSYNNNNVNKNDNTVTTITASNTLLSRSPSPGCRGYTFPKVSSDRLDIIRKDLL